MLDRHDLNHIFLDGETGIYDAVFEHFCDDYPEIHQVIGRDRQNELLKAMAHDFLDCWAVDWWDDLEAFRRFKIAFELSEEEVAAAFFALYDKAVAEGWPRSRGVYHEGADREMWDEKNEDAEYVECTMRLIREDGDPVYGCYAHDAAWWILETWFNKAIDAYGCCEQEVKWALCNLVDSSLGRQYPLERNRLIYCGLVMFPYLVAMPLLILNLPRSGVLLSLPYAGAVLYMMPRFIGTLRMFLLVRKRRFCVNPDAEDVPLPEAARHLRGDDIEEEQK